MGTPQKGFHPGALDPILAVKEHDGCTVGKGWGEWNQLRGLQGALEVASSSLVTERSVDSRCMGGGADGLALDWTWGESEAGSPFLA